MSLKEFSDLISIHFQDPQLIELIINFSTSEDEESSIDLEKVSLLDDIITYLPQIITKSKNLSDGIALYPLNVFNY